jgi:hypothetical protein
MKLVDITNNHFGGKKWCEWWLYLSSPESDDLSLSLPSIILETQKIKMNFYIKIELQKNQGTKWVQIRKLGLNWTFLANFEPTHFRCLFYIGHSSFNFSHGQKKGSNWPSIFQLKDLFDEKQFGDQNEREKTLLQSTMNCKKVHSAHVYSVKTSPLSFLYN